jgi:hypothetical protein
MVTRRALPSIIWSVVGFTFAGLFAGLTAESSSEAVLTVVFVGGFTLAGAIAMYVTQRPFGPEE